MIFILKGNSPYLPRQRRENENSVNCNRCTISAILHWGINVGRNNIISAERMWEMINPYEELAEEVMGLINLVFGELADKNGLSKWFSTIDKTELINLSPMELAACYPFREKKIK